MSALLRLYAADDAGPDGYPGPWHRCPDCKPGDSGCGTCGDYGSIKRLIRGSATSAIVTDLHGLEYVGFRCERCLHPWLPGGIARPNGPEWSLCDEHCRHRGPFRFEGDGLSGELDGDVGTWLERHEKSIEARWRILTTHHLNGNKLDCRWWNLAALCQRCHLTIQGKVVMERRWLAEHSEWFKPHAAGWYAWDRLGEDLSRQQTMERLDELLALEERQLELGNTS